LCAGKEDGCRIKSGMTASGSSVRARRGAKGGGGLNLAKNLAKFDPMATVSVHEAKTNLSRLIAQVEAGAEVVITRNNRPVARLVREGPPKKKPLLGALKGKIEFDDSFFDPLPEDELNAWYGD